MIPAWFLRTCFAVSLLAFCCPPVLNAQMLNHRGMVRDRVTGAPLAFAHILVKEQGSGVVTNKEGEFRLRLPPGVWTLRVSYIGYRSRDVRITAHANMSDIDIELRPHTFAMPEVTVTPDDSLARLIVRRARLRRIEREKELLSFYNRAHSKVYSRIERTENMSDSLAAALSASFLDMGETQTEGWHKRPDKHKVLIHGRRQSDLFERLGNRLHSGFAQVDFSREEINLGSNAGSVTGPISEDGLDGLYWYSVAGIGKGDRHDVYRIRVMPKSDLTPGISGYFYIEDSTWSVTQVELEFNPAAIAVFLPTANQITFNQQYSLYDRKYWLPSAGSVEVKAKVNLMGMIVHLAMDFTAVVAEYRINPAGIDSVFDDYRIEVLPEADEISALEWERRRLQPPSLIDDRIYNVSDSMEAVELRRKMEYNVGHVIGGKELEKGSLLHQIPGLFDAFRFNRVEGLVAAIPYAGEIEDAPLRRYAAQISHGFLDRRIKGSLSAEFALGGRDKFGLSIDAYHDLSPLFNDDMLYGEGVATTAVVLGRYDERDYFYRQGGGLGWNAHALPWLETDLGVNWTQFESAEKHTDWSLFGEGTYRENASVQNGSVLSSSFSLSGDFRSRTLDKGVVTRNDSKLSDFVPSLGVEYRRHDLDIGRWDAWIPQASLSGSLGFGVLGKTNYRLSWARSTETLPVQGLLTLPGSEFGVTTPLRFRTATIGEFAGDERATLNIDHNFGKLPLSFLGLPEGQFYAAEMWELHMFASAGWTRMRPGTASLLTREIHEAKRPLIEAGLSIDRLFGIMRIDIGHRLTHFGSGSDFSIGISISP